MTQIQNCPCGNNREFSQCCGPFISGAKIPETAEELMRSRYTAYTQANIDYIQQTMRGPAAQNFDPVDAKAWALKAKWKRLKVLHDSLAENSQNHAYVRFEAFYIWEGKPQKLLETSEFELINGRWYYTNGRP